MASTQELPFPCFPAAGQTPQESVHKWILDIKRQYILRGLACGDPKTGVVRALFTKQAYANLTNSSEDFSFALPPGAMPKSEEKGFPQWDANNKLYISQQTTLSKLDGLTFAALDAIRQELCLADNDITTMMTGKHIIDTLFASYGAMDLRQLDALNARLAAPYLASEEMETLVLRFKSTYKLLAQQNLAPLDYQKIIALTASVKASSAEPSYRDFFNRWTIGHKILSEQDFDNFCKLLLEFSVVVPLEATVASAGYGAAMVSNQKWHSDADVQILLAAQAAAQAPPPPPPAARRNTKKTRAPRLESTKRSSRPYCYTHGYFGHFSKDCETPNENHQDDAKTHLQYPGGSTKAYEHA